MSDILEENLRRARLYKIELVEGNFDGEDLFEASVRELPDLKEYAEYDEDANTLMKDALATTAMIFAEKNKYVPEPEVHN